MRTEPEQPVDPQTLARFAASLLAASGLPVERFRELFARLCSRLGIPPSETEAILSDALARGPATIAESDIVDHRRMLFALIKVATSEGSLADDWREILEPIAEGLQISRGDLDREVHAVLDGRRPQEVGRPAEDGVPVEWNVGDVILDLYEVKEKLGEGGFGVVHRVLHRGWNLELAVKSPKSDTLRDPDRRRRFVEEAESWVNLGMHPNIVSCFYVRTLGGIPRIFTELVEGGTLHHWIYDRRLYEGGPEAALRRILDVAIQLCWGLYFTHEKGMVHQDFKPENVVMTAEGVARVTDFGSARAMQTTRPSAQGDGTTLPEQEGASDAAAPHTLLVTGGGMTRAYRSPEQGRGERLTRRTDLWSWAVSVLEMFKGDVTWLFGDAAPEALQDLRVTPVADTTFPTMPHALLELLERCFQKDPDARPHDIGGVADELKRVYAKVLSESYPREQPEAIKLLADGLNNRAVSMLDLGSTHEAATLLQQALQADPAHLYATYNHCLLHWRLARTTDDEALARLRAAASTTPSNWEGPLLLAQFALTMGDAEEARRSLNQAQRSPGADSHRLTRLTRLIQDSTCVSRLAWRRQHSTNPHGVGITPDGRFAVSAGCRRSWISALIRPLLQLPRGFSPVHLVGTRRSSERLALFLGSLLGLLLGCAGVVWLWHIWVKWLLLFACLYVLFTLIVRLRTGDWPRGPLGAWTDRASVIVWDAHTGGRVRTISGHPGPVVALRVLPKGTITLTYSEDGTLRAWDMTTGRCYGSLARSRTQPTSRTLRPPSSIWGCPDAPHRLHEEASRIERARRAGLPDLVPITDDGMIAAHQNGTTVEIWDLATRSRLAVFEGHAAKVTAVSISRDGRLAISASDDGTVRVWDMYSRTCHRTLSGHPGGVLCVALTCDGSLAVSGGRDLAVRVWDTESGRCLRTLIGHTMWVGGVAVADLGRVVLSHSTHELIAWQLDLTSRDTAMYEIVRPQGCSELAHDDAIAESAAHSLGLCVALGDVSGAVREFTRVRGVRGQERASRTRALHKTLLSLTSARELNSAWPVCVLRGHGAAVGSIRLGQDGVLAVSGSLDGTVRWWDLSSERSVATADLGSIYNSIYETRGPLHLGVITLCTSGDARTAFVGTAAGVCSLEYRMDGLSISAMRDVRSGLSNAEDLTPRMVHALAATRDADLLVTSTHSDTGAVLWKRCGSCVCEPPLRHFAHSTRIQAVSTTPDGSMLVCAADTLLWTWDTGAGRCLRTLAGHKAPIVALATTADGRVSLSGSVDGTLRAWDIRAGRCVHVLQGHSSRIHSVDLSASGQVGVSSSEDRTIKVWDMLNGRELCTLVGHTAGARSVAISADASIVISGGADASVRVWYLDWELVAHDLVDWHEDARGFLSTFLSCHTPLVEGVPTRRGRASWTEVDFQGLLRELGWAGLGWVRPEGVRRELEKMAATWEGPPHPPGDSS